MAQYALGQITVVVIMCGLPALAAWWFVNRRNPW